MKKLFLLSLLLSVSLSAFCQTEPSVFDSIYALLTTFVPAQTLTIIVFVAWIVSEVLPFIKWAPGNSITLLIWDFFKKLITFLGSKKKK